jgi:hypothetical protein
MDPRTPRVAIRVGASLLADTLGLALARQRRAAGNDGLPGEVLVTCTATPADIVVDLPDHSETPALVRLPGGQTRAVRVTSVADVAELVEVLLRGD